jgi:ribonuclease HI
MNKRILFTDGSVNTQVKTGYGAYLVINEDELSVKPNVADIKVKKFVDTSSTKLELQTLIWALTEVLGTCKKIVVYTDSQNIIGLPERRTRLEENDYCSGKNKLLNNHELYRTFYKIMDQLDCELVKVKGHQPSSQKNNIDLLFTLVDRAARKVLKQNLAIT